MKLQYKSVDTHSLSSIYVKRVRQPYVGGNWHFHKEFELIYFLRGQGMRIVGDHISNFQRGELVLVGEWLPHLWRNDIDVNGEVGADFIVVKFSKDFEGVPLFSLPELAGIRLLLKRSRRGIQFTRKAQVKVRDHLLQLSQSSGAETLIGLLRALQLLSKEQDYRLLSNADFVLPTQLAAENRLQKVINYLSDNYNQGISLEEISDIACMTPPAFCRFFKNGTNKTFSLFLNEIRVSKACQLLISGEKSIKEICYDVGFNSMTNFNRTFKSFKSMTPSEYRARYKAIQHFSG